MRVVSFILMMVILSSCGSKKVWKPKGQKKLERKYEKCPTW